MKKIGLTGGIGVGKTFVASIFQQMGYAVFSADMYAKKCMQESVQLQDAIVQFFGDAIYKKGVLQKQELARVAFSDTEKLNKLNKLVHPFVQLEFQKWCKNQNSHFVLKEAAILFESGAYKNLDAIICVSAPVQTRIKLVMRRDNCSEKAVFRRIENQMSQEEKERLSDFLIVNNGKDKLLPQIIRISEKLINEPLNNKV